MLRKLVGSSAPILQRYCTAEANGLDFLQEFIGRDQLTVNELHDLMWKTSTQVHGGIKNPASNFKFSPADVDTILPPRFMDETVITCLLPFRTQRDIYYSKYENFYGSARMGKIFEDLDRLAGFVSYKYYKNVMDTKAYPVIVTAMVDQIKLFKSLSLDKDCRMIGYVSYVGRSSMEISMFVEQEVGNEWERVIDTKFVMVARDPVQRKATVVNRLVARDEQQSRILKDGANRKQMLKEVSDWSVYKVQPNPEEQRLIHDIFLKTAGKEEGNVRNRHLPRGCVWMDDTLLHNYVFCHPQSRNIHNNIFGGFLFRLAFELGWITSKALCKTADPNLLFVDDISFKEPVNIGSVLNFESRVTYTEKNVMMVEVYAMVRDYSQETCKTTNIFHFGFSAPEENVPTVLPKTYAESMSYLDGRRRYKALE